MSANYQLSSRYPNVKNARVEEEPKATQRVIIPRGMVNPNQTTVINLPAGMENMSTIIAKKSQGNRPLSPARRQYAQDVPQEQPLQYSKGGQQEPQYKPTLQEKLNKKRLKEPTAQDRTDPKYYVRSHPAENARKDGMGYYANYQDQDNRERSLAYNDDQRKSRTLKRYLQIPEEYRTRLNRQSRSPTSASPNLEVNKSLRIKRVLDRLDEIELQGLEEDLKNFQTARRKLIFDVSSMKMF